MEKLELSNRLKEAGKYVRKDEPIADIGSDHAYLPIYLIQQEVIPSAIVGEVVRGPLENAKRTVKTYALEDQISVRLGDGLDVLTPAEKVGTITICGMGGVLIADILQKGLEKNLLPKETLLVLQPNNGEKQLRRFLQKYQYKILAESIVKENEKIYEILVAERIDTQIQYSDDELMFGPYLSKEKSDIFLEKWQNEKSKQEYILNQLKKSNDDEKTNSIQEKLNQIKKVLR